MQIEITGLSKTYVSEGKTFKALDNINLTIPANEFFTLLGPSGCGKTTLLRCIVGLETPDEGEIRIGDEIVWSSAKNIAVPVEKRGLGMVFQTYAIWPHMTVFDNIAYPLQVRGERKEVIREKVANILKFVQLEGVDQRSATRLSGGQQQRVALARALVAEPKVILFDEPLSNLDAKLREETRKELREFLSRLDITAVYVTHDRVEALALSNSIAVMRGGKILEIGTPEKSTSMPTTGLWRTLLVEPIRSVPRCWSSALMPLSWDASWGNCIARNVICQWALTSPCVFVLNSFVSAASPARWDKTCSMARFRRWSL